MKISEAAVGVAVLSVTTLIVAAMVDHNSFMRRASGVMSTESAASLGLVDAAGPWSSRVWFAPSDGGKYEIRQAAAVIGVMPFASTVTSLDLKAACKRLGAACQPV